MSEHTPFVTVRIGSDTFPARPLVDLAPQSWRRLGELLPYSAKLIHARFSGEALWSPLGAAWPSGSLLAAERATSNPQPGHILLYAGRDSEPELLIPYGTTRFACRVGALQGNPVLAIESGLARLAELGREVLWHGAADLRIE